MKKIITYKDDNFLGGTLILQVDEALKSTKGSFTFYDENLEQNVNIQATSKCHKTDTFDEKTGIEVTKLKIVKQYYSYIKHSADEAINFANGILKVAKLDKEYATKKINNVKKALSSYGFTYYGMEPKKIEKPTAKKTTAKKPVKKEPIKKTTKVTK